VDWVGQGVIDDRSKENLRSSDRGIVMIRQRFFDEMDAVEKGHEPKGIIRDPALAKNVELPTIMRKIFVEGIPLKDFEKYPVLKARLADFRWHAGQPKEIRAAFEQALGLSR
jgi:5,5'-dehydrodivanillate O-demethylase